MPILAKNTRIEFPKGSHVGEGKTAGHHPVDAILGAVENFAEEFGREPDQERCTVIVVFTTHETHAEVIEQPEGHDG